MLQALRQITDPTGRCAGNKGLQNSLLDREFSLLKMTLVTRLTWMGCSCLDLVYINMEPSDSGAGGERPTAGGCPLYVLTCHHSLQWLHSAYQKLADM